jgi:hypothetical protein
MSEALFHPIPFLIVMTFLSAIAWGILISILFDYRKPMNSWAGALAVFCGVLAVVGFALLGFCTFAQAPWEARYVPMTPEAARWPHIVGVVNAIAWLGPQLTGALLLGFAWWVWTRFVRDHLYYVIDTRFRHKDAA